MAHKISPGILDTRVDKHSLAIVKCCKHRAHLSHVTYIPAAFFFPTDKISRPGGAHAKFSQAALIFPAVYFPTKIAALCGKEAARPLSNSACVWKFTCGDRSLKVGTRSVSDKIHWIPFWNRHSWTGKREFYSLWSFDRDVSRQNACRSLSRNVDRFALIHRWVPYRYNAAAVRDKDRLTRICSRRKFVNISGSDVARIFRFESGSRLAKDNLFVYLTLSAIVINTNNRDAYHRGKSSSAVFVLASEDNRNEKEIYRFTRGWTCRAKREAHAKPLT